MLVPMITTIEPGSVTVAAGSRDVGVDVGDGDGRARHEGRSSAAASRGQPARRSPIGTSVRDIFSSTTCSKRGSSAAK